MQPTNHHRRFREKTTKMKICSVCKRALPLSEFYNHRRKKDGLSPQCKDCDKKYKRKHRQRPEVKEAALKQKRTDEYRAWQREYFQRPEIRTKRMARDAVNRAVKEGTIPNVSTCQCIDCGGPAQEYHHPDYNKPISVVPLCRLCHSARHRDGGSKLIYRRTAQMEAGEGA